MGLTSDLCEIITRIGAADISAEGYRRANQIVLDGLAVAVAGTIEPGPRILADYLKDQGCKGAATAIGFNFKTSPFNAAYLNGASMHVLDYEPMSNPANHATSPVLPAILAIAEIRRSTGQDLSVALVKGIEMESRLIWATGHPMVYRFHRPGFVGSIGSAVAVAHLLNLSTDKLRQAVGLAASRAAGITGNSGTMTKATHCGMAAANGLEAALLVERGFTASRDILEHHRGFLQAYIDEPFDERCVLGFGAPFRFEEAGYAIKLFPCQYTTHWSIDAALQARRQVPRVEDIERVVVTIPRMINIEGAFPDQGLNGKFSVRYTVACALLDGTVGIDHFADAMLAREPLRALFDKVEIIHDESRPGEAQGRSADIEVKLRDGKVVHAQCLKPAGHYALPPISLEQHYAKLSDCLRRSMNNDEQKDFIDLASSFDKLSRDQITRLIQLIGKPTTRIAQ